MQDQRQVIDCYNKTATVYADKFIDELKGKHLDQILLKAFANENSSKGKLIDLGCGPGQTTKFLYECGVTDLIGVDISPSMVAVAKNLNSPIKFETADILNLPYQNGQFASAIAFYAIVHFDYAQLRTAFDEIKRILKDDGQFLFSFHIGDQVVHYDDFLEHQVSIDFHFFETNKIKDLLLQTGFEIIDILERQPYHNHEYPSKRAYVWVKKGKQNNEVTIM